MRCARFGLWQGARRAHTPPWVCNRRATQPQAKFGETLRAAVLFWPDFVARSLQIHCWICSSLAPRLAKKSLAANVIVFMFMTTKNRTHFLSEGKQSFGVLEKGDGLTAQEIRRGLNAVR